MLQEKMHYANDPEQSESIRISRIKMYKTAAEPLFLRSCCSPSFVKQLKADEGLRAFARLPEREHQLLSCLAALAPVDSEAHFRSGAIDCVVGM